MIHPSEVLTGGARIGAEELLHAPMAPGTEALTALRLEGREPGYAAHATAVPVTTMVAPVSTTSQYITPTTTVVSSLSNVSAIPVTTRVIEENVIREEIRPTTTSISTVTASPPMVATPMVATPMVSTTMVSTPMVSTPVVTPVTGTPLTTTTLAHHEEKKHGFHFPHLFGHHKETTTTSAATGPTSYGPSTHLHLDQADRFIEEFTKHPSELSYYEQFVVQYNRGMRFTPIQARKLVDVLAKNSSAGTGKSVRYYSVYALELLLKLSIVDPIIASEVYSMDTPGLRALSIHKYLADDETKPLGLNFLLFLYRRNPSLRYEEFVVHKNKDKERMLHKSVSDFFAAQQLGGVGTYGEGLGHTYDISRRLPPIIPHATETTGFTEGSFIKEGFPLATSTNVPVIYETTTMSTAPQQYITTQQPHHTTVTRTIVEEEKIKTG